MGIFSNHQRQLTPQSMVEPKFKLVWDFMVVLLSYKNEEDPIKNEGPRVLTRLYVVFSGAQWQPTPQSVEEFC